MSSTLTTKTSATLLARLRRETVDEAAWAEFVQRYGRQVYRWCRTRHLQEADAQDITQTVLVKLAAKMRSFEYDPARSFRAYLKTLAHYAWCDLLESRRQAGAGSGNTDVLRQLESVEARDDLVHHLRAEFDHEVLEEAMARVRQRVEPRTWEAFRLVALEGRPGAEVAAQLAMKVAAVYVAKGRVQKLLQEEVDRMEEPAVEERPVRR
jgi:RNA polymerase sigma-70 factor (ECF subfamily)